jgi:hypothetical protein
MAPSSERPMMASFEFSTIAASCARSASLLHKSCVIRSAR